MAPVYETLASNSSSNRSEKKLSIVHKFVNALLKINFNSIDTITFLHLTQIDNWVHLHVVIFSSSSGAAAWVVVTEDR